MKPAVFSMMRHHTTKNGWIRDARNVVYGRSKFQGADGQRSRLYTLSFTLMFEEDRDYVLVAMNLPYSYSRLMDFIRKEQALQETRQSEVNMRLETIGYSLSNNAVPLILVEPKVVSEGPKRMIVVSARQHPGETWSSFLMEGVIKQLLNSCSESGEYLRKYFTFAIFPMINVDGVIYGNFRCDISGVDLNRQWNDPCPTLHPQVHAIR
jgi:murein tripeptide amidase MpaA